MAKQGGASSQAAASKKKSGKKLHTVFEGIKDAYEKQMNEAQALHPKYLEKYQVDKDRLLPAFAVDPKQVTTTATSANGSALSL